MSKAKHILSKEDIEILKVAIQTAKDNKCKLWDQDILKPVKRKIKTTFRGILNERCCYCCKNTEGEFNMVLDIEHILPKAHFGKFSFSPFNLSIACKRCNMEIKGEDRTFLVNEADAHANPEKVDNYKFIHPNLDEYFGHIQYDVIIRNDKKLIKYTVINDSPKGKFTYDYFDLIKLEVNSLCEGQGITTQEVKFSELISKKIIAEIQNLLK